MSHGHSQTGSPTQRPLVYSGMTRILVLSLSFDSDPSSLGFCSIEQSFLPGKKMPIDLA